MEKREGPVLIVFLDCLCVQEAQKSEWMAGKIKGRIESGIPRVTPYVLCGMMTGMPPTEHGILCPTRLDRPQLGRPQVPVLFEQMSADRRLLNFEIPFTWGLQGEFLTNIGSAPQVIQQSRPGWLAIPRPVSTFWDETGEDDFDIEKTLDSHIDYVTSVFSSVRNMLRHGMFDVAVVSIRSIDSFGHFLFREQRERLIKACDRELKITDMMGDIPIMFFSDHGIQEKEHAFYLNKWLMEQGWLNVDVFMPAVNRIHKANEVKNPMDMISLHNPWVDIKEDSIFCSPDAYDSGILILAGEHYEEYKLDSKDEAPVDELIQALTETGMYNSVQSPVELYGDGEFADDLGVDLVCDRADGVLVSGNIHPNITVTVDADNFCQSHIRTGVHTRYGVWGTNITDFRPSMFEEDEDLMDVIDVDTAPLFYDLTPQQYYHVVKEWIDEWAETPDYETLYGIENKDKDREKGEAEMLGKLEQLGYV